MGKIQQVVVDLRENSPTYMKYESFNISETNQKIILIPPLMGNGYCVLSNEAIYHYKLAYTGSYFDSNKQFTFKWNDERMKIKWKINNPILSNRDE